MQEFRLKTAPYLAIALAVVAIVAGLYLFARGNAGGLVTVGLGALIIVVVIVFLVIGKRRGVL